VAAVEAAASVAVEEAASREEFLDHPWDHRRWAHAPLAAHPRSPDRHPSVQHLRTVVRLNRFAAPGHPSLDRLHQWVVHRVRFRFPHRVLAARGLAIGKSAVSIEHQEIESETDRLERLIGRLEIEWATDKLEVLTALLGIVWAIGRSEPSIGRLGIEWEIDRSEPSIEHQPIELATGKLVLLIACLVLVTGNSGPSIERNGTWAEPHFRGWSQVAIPALV